MSKTIIGVMGPGAGAKKRDKELAFELGRQIARNNWVLLTGGRNVGVMHEASRGAKKSGGLTIGVLPTAGMSGASEYVDIPIRTGMGSARNSINVLSSDIIVGCGAGLGTVSEIVLAYKAGKPVVLLHQSPSVLQLLEELTSARLKSMSGVAEVIETIRLLLS